MYQKRLPGLQLASLPLLITTAFASPALLAEQGFAHDSSGAVVRDDFGNCVRTDFKDAGFPIDPSCYGDADGDGVVDPLDACPDTPKGSKVDDKGCAQASDSDGDGVTDDMDQCPNTPAGDQVDANGCTLIGDADGDGVKDDMDQCPNTPAGDQVDANGCSVTADADNDGVADSRDQCPNTPAGAKVNANGCAVAITLQNINFQTGSSNLTAASKSNLDKVAAALKARPDIKGVEVIGHTDDTGPAGFNQRLSESRAKSVRDYLVSQGVDADRITSSGRGESEPVADNGSAEGRRQNRRVELKLSY